MLDDINARMASITAFLAGLFLFIASASYLFWPSRIFSGVDFYYSILRHVFLFRFTYIMLALYALFSLAVVLMVSDLVQAAAPNLVRWVRLLALLGFSVAVLNFLFYPVNAVETAQAYHDQQGTYNGIGLYLYANDAGQILLAPFANSPAAQAGILTGDELVAIKNVPITPKISPGKAVELLAKNIANGFNVISVRTGDQKPRLLALQPGRINYWDLQAQFAIGAMPTPNLDPHYLFSFGLVGVWFLFVNWLALRKSVLPARLAWVGISVGITYWIFVASFLFHVGIMTNIAVIASLVLGPLWFIWIGVMHWQPLPSFTSEP